jgi:hypothetical protein
LGGKVKGKRGVFGEKKEGNLLTLGAKIVIILSYGLVTTYGLFWAYHGAVAQLGERCVRNAQVGGSIPLSSTVSEMLNVEFCMLNENDGCFVW